jgi:hypothetical protein
MFLRSLMDARIKSGHDELICVDASFPDIASRSRRAIPREFLLEFLTLHMKGRGKCRALDAPAALCAKIKSTQA